MSLFTSFVCLVSSRGAGRRLAGGVALLGALVAACSEGDAGMSGGSLPSEVTAGHDGGDGASGPGTSLSPSWRVQAGQYLEARTDAWVMHPPAEGNVKCAMSCHTTYPYLLARHALGADFATPAASEARARFEARVAQGDAATPFYGQGDSPKVHESRATEALLNAAALSLDDVWSGRPLSSPARAALDRMWAQQSDEGSWRWLEFGLEPWETRTDFGLVTGLLVVSQIPKNTSAAQATGTSRMVELARARLATMSLHDRALLVWVDGLEPGLLDGAQRAAILDELVGHQLDDGGFPAGAWGHGARAAEVASASDGYATAVATLALCHEAGRVEARARALGWLTTHQASNGCWPGQSVNSPDELNRTFMTDAATAYAVLALTRCGAR